MIMMQVTSLLVTSALTIGLSTGAVSATTWGSLRTSSTTGIPLLQRNPWLIQNTDRIVNPQEYILSIRGGSSATGKYGVFCLVSLSTE